MASGPVEDWEAEDWAEQWVADYWAARWAVGTPVGSSEAGNIEADNQVDKTEPTCVRAPTQEWPKQKQAIKPNGK